MFVHRRATIVAIAMLSVAMKPTDETFEAAKAAFTEGVTHLDAGRHDEAVVSFERSVELRPAPPALYNLGLAYRASGRIEDAIRAFERFLDVSTEAGHTSGVEHAQVLVEALRADLVHLSIAVEGEVAKLEVDGRAVGKKKGIYGVVLEPGTHRVVATAADGTTKERTAQLEPGGRLSVTLDLTPPPAAVPPPPPPAPPPPIVTPPPEPASSANVWIWTGVIAVAAAAAATAITIVATRPEDPTFDGGSTGVVLRGLGGAR